MRIDAHHHFWRLSRGDYAWLTPERGVLFRDYTPDDLVRPLREAGIDASIVVQAAQSGAETDFLLEMARSTPWIAGVVGWTDLSAEDAPEVVAHLGAHADLIGLRPMLQDLHDPDWILQPAVDPALCAMAEAGLVLDALVREPQRHGVAELARRHPQLAIVLDHAGKPVIADGVTAEWRRDIAAAAGYPNVSVKLSGLLSEAPAGADLAMLGPFVTVLVDTFGPERIVWGSDWPVLLAADSYAGWSSLTDALLAHLSDRDQRAIRGGNAARIYGIQKERV